jgi:hypothetical protein
VTAAPRWCDVPACRWPAELREAAHTALALALWGPLPHEPAAAEARAYIAGVARLLHEPAAPAAAAGGVTW